MKAYLIDPNAKEVTLVRSAGPCWELKDIYTLLGCTCISSGARFIDGDTLYLDDEGLFVVDDDNPGDWYVVPGQPQPLVGRAIILGTDESTGEWTEPKLELADYQNSVKFINWQTARTLFQALMKMPLPKEADLLGEKAFVIDGRYNPFEK